jgi:hypothetical protein
MLKDKQPSENEEIVVTNQPKVGVPGISDDEPDAPKPFTFTRLRG